jgi:hypothetical protein
MLQKSHNVIGFLEDTPSDPYLKNKGVSEGGGIFTDPERTKRPTSRSW